MSALLPGAGQRQCLQRRAGPLQHRAGGGGGGVDYEELLNQKRRDEARYRHGNDPYNDYARSGQLKASTSDGFLNRVAPAPVYNSQGINQEMEDLSQAVKMNYFVKKDARFVLFSCQDYKTLLLQKMKTFSNLFRIQHPL